MKISTLLFFLIFFSVAAPAEDKFDQYFIRGHEQLIESSVDMANSFLGERSFKTDLLIRGSIATDFPRLERQYSLNEFYRVSMGEFETEFQSLHFLRHLTNGVISAASDTCEESNERILNASLQALANWDTDRDKANFFLGHVLHIIEDSFSKAHTLRSLDFYDIEDICIYTVQISGVCTHASVDSRDLVFKPNCSTGYDCLKDEAKAAAKAGAAYLILVDRFLKNPGENFDDLLTGFFEDRVMLPFGTGYFSCPQ